MSFIQPVAGLTLEGVTFTYTMCVKGQTWSLLICKIHWKIFSALHVWHVLQVSSEACTIPLTNTCHPCKSSRSCKMIKVSVLSQRFFEKLGHRIQHPAWRENPWAPLYSQAVGLSSLLICALNLWFVVFLPWRISDTVAALISGSSDFLSEGCQSKNTGALGSWHLLNGKGSKAKHLLGMSLKVEMSYWSNKVRSNTENQGCLMLINFNLNNRV